MLRSEETGRGPPLTLIRWGVTGTQSGILKAIASGKCIGTAVTTKGVYGRNVPHFTTTNTKCSMSGGYNLMPYSEAAVQTLTTAMPIATYCRLDSYS